MESEIPEVVVFFNANDQCQLFKDVGIDEEVLCHDKCCVQDCELDHNNISNLLKYELAKTSTDVSEEVVLYISTGVEESFSNHHCLEEDVKLCGAHNKLMEDKAGFGGSADIANVHSLKKEPFKSRNVTTSDQITKFSLFQLLKANDDIEDAQNNHQEQNRDATPAESRSSGKKGDCIISDAIESRLEMDLGPESTKNEECKSTKISGVEHPSEAETICDNGANTLEKPLLSSSSLSHQNTLESADVGSSRFSAASTSSGRLTFSGSVLNSDNISLRSNSTTSTTSFAFPILATEWNESPIRMAEVDRRRRIGSKKCTCWRMCFSCSNF